MQTYKELNLHTILIFFLLSLLIVQIQSGCVMTADGTSSEGNVAPNKTPFQLRYGDNPKVTLQDVCRDYSNDDFVCCNYTQVENLNNRLKLITASFWRCPACVKAMKRLWCDFTCSNEQDKFVSIKSFHPDGKYIESVYFALSPHYLSHFWETCKENQMGNGKIRVTWPTVQEFFEYMATQKSDPTWVPVFVNESAANPDNSYYGVEYPCNTTCNCAYCATCSIDEIKPDYSCYIYGLQCDIAGFIAVGCIGGITLLAILISMVQLYKSKWKRVKATAEEKKPLM